MRRTEIEESENHGMKTAVILWYSDENSKVAIPVAEVFKRPDGMITIQTGNVLLMDAELYANSIIKAIRTVSQK